MKDPSDTPLVDAQVHAWVSSTPRFPWSEQHLRRLPARLRPLYETGDHSAERVVVMMDEAGVDVAVLTSTFLYGTDPSYALDAAARFPGRFVVVAYVDDTVPDLASYLDWTVGQRDLVGLRVFLGTPDAGAPGRGVGAGSFLEDVADAGLPLFVSPMGSLDRLAALATSRPATPIVVDHLGLWIDAPRERRWRLADQVLALAAIPNIHIKCSAAPELSRERFPFPDVLALLDRYVAAFGTDRLLWGSDINQHLDSLSYADAVDYVRCHRAWSAEQRAMLLGGTAVRLLGLAGPSR
ncbi:amidohydrolase family protein [Nocardioides humi]|uniref:Amidohydrolase family protein n=2 Tax=Nocardioides humi TaxID=449461 RepID=A0ABN2B522_9ACTN